MSILNVKVEQAGMSGVLPKVIYIDTNDTLAAVTAAGYLNGLVRQNLPISEKDMALVTTKTSPSASSTQVAWLEVSKSGDNWSLVASNTQLPLANANIFVGNASGVATGVSMSGDATIDNAGVLTLEDDSVVTSNITDANVTLPKLAAGITPSHVIKFAAQYTTTGGSASEAITVTGALATDLAFVQVVDDGTAGVTVLQAAVTSNTLTVTFSADPGNDTIINYQIIRAAA